MLGLSFDLHESVQHLLGLLESGNDILEDIRENTSEKPKVEVNARRSGSAQAGGAGGAVDVILNGPPPGWSWKLERLATTAGGAGTGLAVYLDTVDPINLIHVVTNPTLWAEGFPAEIYVPPNRSIIFRFAGQAANSVCTVAIQSKQFREEHDALPAHLR